MSRDFRFLQTRFAIVKNPALMWNKVKIRKIMKTCIILHNMIVEDEQNRYTQFDVSVFTQGRIKPKFTSGFHLFYIYAFKSRQYDEHSKSNS